MESIVLRRPLFHGKIGMALSDTLEKIGWIPVHAFNDAGDRVYWPYLLSSVFIGILWTNLVLRDNRSLLQSLSLIFPKSARSSASMGVDIGFTWLSLVIQSSILAGLATGLCRAVELSAASLTFLDLTFHSVNLSENTRIFLGTALITLATDFALFLAHWLQHRVPVLWRFHAIHHSAESLTPFTAYRQHPIDYLGNTLCLGLLSGLAFVLIKLFTGEPAHILQIEGSAVPFLIFYWLGYHLRHSAVWVDYGPRWSYVFISPAQHQIHHSRDLRHRDKNLGYMFSLWDLLFGTLYIPKTHEQIRYGLSEPPLNGGFLALLWTPFKEVLQATRPASLVLTALLLISLGLIVSNHEQSSLSDGIAQADKLWLERLTSPEANEAIQKGFDRVIIPTGGTEQNGAHLALGKHNAIIEHNAEQLALRLGSTLIAPVMAYVPEGQTSPSEGHMRYPGTLSLQESTFEAVLEDTARSLKTHGFHWIFFLGDSGGNQNAQNRVAERLTALWVNEKIKVVALSDYYRLEPQIHYLENQGFSPHAIGNHAGIRDTSEIEFIAPHLLRRDQFDQNASTEPAGSDGDPKRASADIGEFLTQLKVNAALNQARKMLSTSD